MKRSMNQIPRTKDEAKRAFLHLLTESNALNGFKEATQESVIFNVALWQAVMKAYLLDQGNAELIASCGVNRPDDAAKIIVLEAWEEAKGITKYAPKTLDEAVRLLLELLPPKAKKELAAISEKDLPMMHMGLGGWIRNTFSMWRGNEALIVACGTSDADGASMCIIKEARRILGSANNQAELFKE